MSEILFKGRHIHVFPGNTHLDDAWVYGYLSDENYIYCPELEVEVLINPETISQYTRRKDINKQKIWENDIVRYFEVVENYDCNLPCFDVNKGIYEPRRTRHKVEFIAVVRFDEEMSAYVVNPIYCTEHMNYVRRRLGEYPMEDIEVIGNVFDDYDIKVKSRPVLHIIQNENGGWEIIQK